MRVFHIVSSGDAQSIPLELALRLPLPETDIRIAVFSGESAFQKTSQDARILHINARSSGDLSAVARLKHALFEYDPDVIHVHHAASSFWGVWAGRMARRKGGGPRRLILKTEHNDRHHQGIKNDLINLATYALLDGVVCNSDATRKSLKPLERRLIKNRAWTIYNGVDGARVQQASSSDASVRKTYDLLEENFCIGTVGRFVEQKNYTALIKATAEARTLGAENLTLVLIGAGPLGNTLRQQVERLGLADQVIFTGAKSRDQVYELLGAMDAFVMPSLWEGFCNAAVEAMAAGLPIAASDIPVLHEVLGEGPHYFDPRSVPDMAKALLELSRMSAEDRQQAGRRNQSKALKYEITKAADNYMALYRALLAGENPNP